MEQLFSFVMAGCAVWGAVSLHRIAYHLRNLSDDGELMVDDWNSI